MPIKSYGGKTFGGQFEGFGELIKPINKKVSSKGEISISLKYFKI